MAVQTRSPYAASDFSDYIRETLSDGRYVVDGELFDEIVAYANREMRLKDIAASCSGILNALPEEELVMLLAADADDPANMIARALEHR